MTDRALQRVDFPLLDLVPSDPTLYAGSFRRSAGVAQEWVRELEGGLLLAAVIEAGASELC